ncbi:MAG TPA: ABC transporter ATP-binding protein [Coriobacteriia bacterium]
MTDTQAVAAVDVAASHAIAISGARKVYTVFPQTKRVAVEDVSITVPVGAIHGLLGPNGAGKTTTLKMLLGLVRPGAGTFRVLGLDSRSRAGRAALGFLPEQPYFPPQLSAAQAMRLYARLSGVPEREIKPRTAELLERVGLAGQQRTLLSAFSRGMLQRLGIAQAIVGRPSVVVLDEPASGLDPLGQRDVRNLMLMLRDEGATVLLSSHQLSEVEAVCDRVSIMSRGRVAAEGPIQELLGVAGATSVTVAGLSGDAPSALTALAGEATVVEGGLLLFSVPDASVRSVVDAVDDAGGTIISVLPKRESLEDYFTRMLSNDAGEVA